MKACLSAQQDLRIHATWWNQNVEVTWLCKLFGRSIQSAFCIKANHRKQLRLRRLKNQRPRGFWHICFWKIPIKRDAEVWRNTHQVNNRWSTINTLKRWRKHLKRWNQSTDHFFSDDELVDGARSVKSGVAFNTNSMSDIGNGWQWDDRMVRRCIIRCPSRHEEPCWSNSVHWHNNWFPQTNKVWRMTGLSSWLDHEPPTEPPQNLVALGIRNHATVSCHCRLSEDANFLSSPMTVLAFMR